MPIVGLTKEEKQPGRGLPRIAKLYKGDEKSPNKPGVDLDYFRVEFEPEFQGLQQTFEDLYGTQPRQLSNVMLIAPGVNGAFPTWNEEWNATGLLNRCDGETRVAHFDTQAQSVCTTPTPCTKQCRCKPSGTLKFMLSDFTEETGLLGVFSITTHSIYDIATIHNYLLEIARLRGKLTGVPFTFGRKRREVTGKIKGERKRITKSLIYMHVAPEYVKSTDFFQPQISTPALPAPSDAAIDAEIIDDDTTLTTPTLPDAQDSPETEGETDTSKVQKFRQGVTKRLEELEIDEAEFIKVLRYIAGNAGKGRPAATWEERMALPPVFAKAALVTIQSNYAHGWFQIAPAIETLYENLDEKEVEQIRTLAAGASQHFKPTVFTNPPTDTAPDTPDWMKDETVKKEFDEWLAYHFKGTVEVNIGATTDLRNAKTTVMNQALEQKAQFMADFAMWDGQKETWVLLTPDMRPMELQPEDDDNLQRLMEAYKTPEDGSGYQVARHAINPHLREDNTIKALTCTKEDIPF